MLTTSRCMAVRCVRTELTSHEDRSSLKEIAPVEFQPEAVSSVKSVTHAVSVGMRGQCLLSSTGALYIAGKSSKSGAVFMVCHRQLGVRLQTLTWSVSYSTYPNRAHLG